MLLQVRGPGLCALCATTHYSVRQSGATWCGLNYMAVAPAGTPCGDPLRGLSFRSDPIRTAELLQPHCRYVSHVPATFVMIRWQIWEITPPTQPPRRQACTRAAS